MVYVLVDGILNPHEPTLKPPVHCVPPFELRGERDSDPQDAASDRLNRCFHREVWQGLKASPDLLADGRVEPEHATNLLRAHVEQSLHRRLPLLELVERLWRERLLKLSQRVLVRPDSKVHSLGQRQQLFG